MRFNNSGFLITAFSAFFAFAAAADANHTNPTADQTIYVDDNPTRNHTDPTRIESYTVNTTIESRFARTKVSVDFVNERNCSTVRGFTFQLPIEARVTALIMSGSNGCTMNSTVKEQEQAEEEFYDNANQGKPAALLTAYDSTNYAVQVSLPPLGKTRVDFSFEELLVRKSHQIPFQVPIFPGVPVERLQMDISVHEPQTGVATFRMDDDGDVGRIDVETLSETMSSAHYERYDLINDDSLPRLIRGYYDTGPLPVDGMLIPDRSGSCLVHLFNPTSFLESSGSLPRDIVFVIDVSGSMSGQKLLDAKDAFAAIIEELAVDDRFAVHTFSDNGIEDSWGPSEATTDSISSATRFVQSRETIGGTNLNDAYLRGIERVENMQDSRSDGSSHYAVPIVMMLSDGEGSLPGSEVARNVRNANERISAKIYNLAFGFGADIDLLTGISIQNGGITAQIYEGYGDAVTQMQDFYVGELGSILMSDLAVSFDGTVGIESHTQLSHSVFADGSEIAVRARTSPQHHSTTDPTTDPTVPARTIRATTIANTLQGTSTWQTDLQLDVARYNEGDTESSECLQSFSHAKIKEILMFRDAARSLGDEMDNYAPSYLLHNGLVPASQAQAQLRSGSANSGRRDLTEIAEAQALELALEAGVVWPGLTAIVTVSNSACESLHNDDTEVCFDGDEIGGGGGDAEMADMGTLSQGGASLTQGAPQGGQGGAVYSYDNSGGRAVSPTCSFAISAFAAIAAAMMTLQ